MKVWVVEIFHDDLHGYEISKICSSFEKAKDSVRTDVQEFFGQFDEETVTEVMNDFEKEGWIEEFVHISGYEVD